MKENCSVLSVAQMAAADQTTVDSGTSAVELMNNAGHAVAAEISKRFTPCSVLVLCGPGNNGGDGFVIARALAERGWDVRVAAEAAHDLKRSAEASHHAALWRGETAALRPDTLQDAKLLVDAVFGAGLNRAFEGGAAALLRGAKARGVPIVAVDVPSGVLGDSGVSAGAIQSTLTVTFFKKKPAHLLEPGRSLCGEVVVADIGISNDVLESIAPTTFENAPTLWRSELRRPDAHAHKYTRGLAWLWGGYPMTGAARLSARAAARVGAGVTAVGVPTEAFAIYAAALTSIMVQPLETLSDFDAAISEKRVSALLIGPGAGASADTRARVLKMLATRRPTVIDADAISAFRDDKPSLLSALHADCVLTPHEGEFARLFDFQGSKIERARSAATQCGAVVVLKGSDTVIASPDGRAVINSNAPPTLATGGSGDVLAGMVLGLLAQGIDSFLAAAAAVWLHGAAAAAFGPGLVADDLPELLPQVLRRLDASSLSRPDGDIA